MICLHTLLLSETLWQHFENYKTLGFPQNFYFLSSKNSARINSLTVTLAKDYNFKSLNRS